MEEFSFMPGYLIAKRKGLEQGQALKIGLVSSTLAPGDMFQAFVFSEVLARRAVSRNAKPKQVASPIIDDDTVTPPDKGEQCDDDQDNPVVTTTKAPAKRTAGKKTTT